MICSGYICVNVTVPCQLFGMIRCSHRKHDVLIDVLIYVLIDALIDVLVDVCRANTMQRCAWQLRACLCIY